MSTATQIEFDRLKWWVTKEELELARDRETRMVNCLLNGLPFMLAGYHMVAVPATEESKNLAREWVCRWRQGK